jgi:hypothetical protein
MLIECRLLDHFDKGPTLRGYKRRRRSYVTRFNASAVLRVSTPAKEGVKTLIATTLLAANFATPESDLSHCCLPFSSASMRIDVGR